MVDETSVDIVAIELMTQAAYARHRGVSKQAINKAVKLGKIRLHEENGRKGIDPAEADRALGLNAQRVISGEADGPAVRGMVRQAAPGLTQARTATEVYRARMAELEYNERLGKLRPVEQIEEGAVQCFDIVVRSLGGIVGRAEEIDARAKREGVTGVRDSLRRLVRDIRNTAANEFRKLANGEVIDAPAASTEFESEN